MNPSNAMLFLEAEFLRIAEYKVLKITLSADPYCSLCILIFKYKSLYEGVDSIISTVITSSYDSLDANRKFYAIIR